jgi:hypothetical protein
MFCAKQKRRVQQGLSALFITPIRLQIRTGERSSLTPFQLSG